MKYSIVLFRQSKVSASQRLLYFKAMKKNVSNDDNLNEIGKITTMRCKF